MKNKFLLVLTIILILTLGVAMIGCKEKEQQQTNPTPQPPDVQKDIQEIDFFMAANDKGLETSKSIVISLDGDVVYSLINGEENAIVSDLVGAGDNISPLSENKQYSAEDFTTIELKNNVDPCTYKATIKNPQEFLGIQGNIQNATIVITIHKDTKILKAINIAYQDVRSEEYTFDVKIDFEY